MEKYLYSAVDNAFYPYSLEDEYKAAGSWPEDGIDVEESLFQDFTADVPTGKVRVAGDDKLPAWGDVSALTHDESVAQAKETKAQLISSAKQAISIWQSELLMDEISDADKTSLKLWISYIKEIQAVDITQPGSIEWPTPPANNSLE
ncbi:tail fiber assembly protein [Rahnella sp. PAMC 25559]|uniref:tail fiber assembly protein n=1 Tax=Rahnella sp. PAMC 25559 TaxID=3423225 RepID=UPI003D669A9C